MLIRFAVLMLALGAGGGCGGQAPAPSPVSVAPLVWRKPSQPVALPAWAAQLPPEFRRQVAVGYSRLARPEESLELATQSAYENLARSQRVRILSRRWEIFEDRFRFPVEYADELLDSSAVEGISSQAVVLDTFVIQGKRRSRTVRTYILVGLSDISLPANMRRVVRLDRADHPDWFSELPEEPGYIYGVGSCGHYRDVADSWAAAEKLARLELAFQRGVEAGSIQMDKLSQIHSASGVLEQTIETELRDAVIAARHYNPKMRMFYALARMPIR